MATTIPTTDSELLDRVLDTIALAKLAAVANQLAGLGRDAALTDHARIAGMLDMAAALGYPRDDCERWSSNRARNNRLAQPV